MEFWNRGLNFGFSVGVCVCCFVDWVWLKVWGVVVIFVVGDVGYLVCILFIVDIYF